MKAVRILAVLVILIFVVDGLKDAVSGVVDGWNEAGDTREFTNYPVWINVRADRTVAADSLLNVETGHKTPYRLSTIQTEVSQPEKHLLFLILTFPISLFAIYGFYCMTRVVLTVTRGDVFNRKNVRRMRLFIYSLIFAAFWFELQKYLDYQSAVSQIQLAGYHIEPYSTHYPWLTYTIIALLIEIFAVGVKIKEEQDLTI